MKNFRRSRKALSPVVASIILIAVTVAVSIAVAAWMGALTIGFMGGSEQVELRSIAFSATGSPAVNNNITVAVKNTGTSAVTIQEVWVNNADKTSVSANTAGGTLVINANQQIYITITYAWTAGDNYQVKLVTAKGNSFMRNAIPPS
ncbi:hypothetical protein MUO79_00755 [Candidatus Bathyarchaeota archaeon]|nr:hypothetical protein [Candidatus Bathyarchaeota archaeon]